MTPAEDKICMALRETAQEIPADPPPLRLGVQRRPARRRRGWHAWVAPLASGVVVVAVIVASMALVQRPHPGRVTGPAAGSVGANGVPPYYVALVTSQKPPDEYNFHDAVAEVRATDTGAVIAAIAPPKPYVTFAGVTAAADDRTFVLVAKASNTDVPVPAARFFLLRIDPGAPGRQATMQPLPSGFIPAGAGVIDMALSPDGTSLAAGIGDIVSSRLYVYDLATGTQRTWSYRACGQCLPSAGGLGLGGVNADALSWTADGQHIAFVASRLSPKDGGIRLLDISRPGTDMLANSERVAQWPSGYDEAAGSGWRGALITPDGKTVLAVEELVTREPGVRERLVKFSAATGNQTATVNDLGVTANYEQILHTDATGDVLILSYAHGDGAEILSGGRYTPIPWTSSTVAAAW